MIEAGMALAKCPVYVDGRTCGLDLVEENPPDGKFAKIYVCARGHIPYCFPADSFYPGNRNATASPAPSSIRVVQLRDHPLMTRKSGVSTWPPRWTTTRLDVNDTAIGEIGTLERTMIHQLLDNKIFLFIHYNGSRYMGLMQFDDRRFCSQIFKILQANVGHSIKDIGDLDLSHTF
jgi:hypothetical protein